MICDFKGVVLWRFATVGSAADQRHLRQKDLVDVFGTPSIVSEVLSEKQEM
jgi:antitoxin component HigA of HigAB toxin-antitoxin module